jgi:hypothetical protein
MFSWCLLRSPLSSTSCHSIVSFIKSEIFHILLIVFKLLCFALALTCVLICSFFHGWSESRRTCVECLVIFSFSRHFFGSRLRDEIRNFGTREKSIDGGSDSKGNRCLGSDRSLRRFRGEKCHWLRSSNWTPEKPRQKQSKHCRKQTSNWQVGFFGILLNC